MMSFAPWNKSIIMVVCFLVIGSGSLSGQARTTPVEVKNPVAIDQTSNTVKALIDPVENIIKAEQYGGWAVTITGVPNVSVANSPNVNVLNSPTVKLDSALNTVRLDSTANTVKAQQTGTWSVSLSGTPSVLVANTPAVSVSNSPTVKLDSLANSVRIDSSANIVQTLGKYDSHPLWSTDKPLPHGGYITSDTAINCGGYREMRAMIALTGTPPQGFDFSKVRIVVFFHTPNGFTLSAGSFGFTASAVTNHPDYVPPPNIATFILPVMGHSALIRIYNNNVSTDTAVSMMSYVYLAN